MTVLRRVGALAIPEAATPRVLGVDDWAWRKGRRYGTVFVDLEQHRVVDLLPDRSADTLAQWLTTHPGVDIVSRDRASAYAEGARQGAPQAVQIADRFHVVNNVGDAFEQVLGRHHADERRASAPPGTSAAVPTVRHSTRHTITQADHAAKREQRYTMIHGLAQQGQSIHASAQTLGLVRVTVRRYLRAASMPVADLRTRRHLLVAPYAAYLEARLTAGCHNTTVLWRELQAHGYTGGISILKAYLAPWRAAGRAMPPARRWSARQTMWRLRQAPDARDPAEHAYCERLLRACPELAEVHQMTTTFLAIVRERDRATLDPWVDTGGARPMVELRAFAAGIRRDYAAVVAALEHPWNNGMVEGQVNRLKLIKRQGYGQAGFALLRQTRLSVTPSTTFMAERVVTEAPRRGAVDQRQAPPELGVVQHLRAAVALHRSAVDAADRIGREEIVLDGVAVEVARDRQALVERRWRRLPHAGPLLRDERDGLSRAIQIEAVGGELCRAAFAAPIHATDQLVACDWLRRTRTVRESLTDRQAADAMRTRIDLKYLLSLELTDRGFDHTVLSEFWPRLLTHGAGSFAHRYMLYIFQRLPSTTELATRVPSWSLSSTKKAKFCRITPELYHSRGMRSNCQTNASPS